MPPKANPLKLNKLQLRTLVIAQVLARDSEGVTRDPASGEARLTRLPQAHGNHFHVGRFSVPAQAASGLFNDAVWKVLARKGLGRAEPDGSRVLTPAGLDYDTGMGDAFEEADH